MLDIESFHSSKSKHKEIRLVVAQKREVNTLYFIIYVYQSVTPFSLVTVDVSTSKLYCLLASHYN